MSHPTLQGNLSGMNIEDPIIFRQTYMSLHPEKNNGDKKTETL